MLAADVCKKWINQTGKDKVGAICTDDAANMRKARYLLTHDTEEFQGFPHILEYRYEA